MKSKEEALKAVFTKFPQYTDLIAELFDGNENFRSSCEDYNDCIMMLSSLSYQRDSICEILDEYRTLKKEIELELLEKITE